MYNARKTRRFLKKSIYTFDLTFAFNINQAKHDFTLLQSQTLQNNQVCDDHGTNIVVPW